MEQKQQQQQQEGQATERNFDPGHVMTRQHYERLARAAAEQK